MLIRTEDTGERPAGDRGECFYCRRPTTEMHAKDCVIPQRTIVIRFSMEMVVTVPRYWDKEAIEFKFNESSSCNSNLVEQLQEEESQAEDGCCFTCHRSEVEYLREATQEDHNELVPPKAKRYEPEVILDLGAIPILGGAGAS